MREAAAHQFEQSRVHVPVRVGADMRQARDPRLRVANEGDRPSDVAHRPQCEREVMHRRDARVPSKTEREIVVAPRLEQGQRAFQMVLRFAILSGEPARDSDCTMGNAGLRRIGPRLDVAEERLRVGPHRPQLAPDEAADP